MWKGLVQPRPFIKERKSASSFSSTKFGVFSAKSKGSQKVFYHFLFQKYSIWLVGSVFFLLLGLFFLKWTWYNPNYLIQTINYTSETRKEYENTELYVLTSKYLRGQYLNSVQLWEIAPILSKVREEYPFVKDINIKYTAPQTIDVSFDFFQPEMRIKLGEKLFGVRGQGKTAELKPKWTLAQTGFLIDTPQYLSGTASLSGFFFEVPYEWYQENIPKIYQVFPDMTRFVYLAGSPNFIVFDNNKQIYIHRDNIDLQLQKYRRLQQNFANFKGIFEIDLGSFTQNRLIIRE